MADYKIRAMKEKERAKVLADQIEELSITIQQKAGEKGKLYGSVTTMDLAAAIAEQGIDIDRPRKIKLTEPIKSLGDFQVSYSSARRSHGQYFRLGRSGRITSLP